MLARLLIFLGLVPWLVQSLGATDSVSDADLAQTGYLANHNMDPAVVASPSFGILWTNKYLNKEKWYAKPLVYTPPGKKQLVFLASAMNYIRTLDAVTGALLNQRQVQPPFLQSEIGCYDIPDYIGIIGTPVIDPNTDTAYFFSKGYRNGATNGGGNGVANGIYKFYAVSVLDLTDRPGFPVLIDGHNADNDARIYFNGGTVLQRPAMTLIDGNVYAGFGGHCDKYNYTGMMVSVSTTPGVGVVSIFAMESGEFGPTSLDLNKQGGQAGIWMSGMAAATDGQRIFVTTGNGKGHVNKDTPASGRSPLSTLDEVIANIDISSGKMVLKDYFEPYEYIGMDAGDRDLGSGGVALLDSTVFKGTNGVTRLALTIGKNGKLYVCNADNLGGYKLGPGATDNVVQTIISPNAVFGGVGSSPLDKLIYFTPVGYPTLVYSFGLDQRGGPLFSKVGETPDKSAGRVGVGTPTITSFKGQKGSTLMWVTDVDAGLKVYKAVPNSNGLLTKIDIPPTGGLNKFLRPVFGDGRLYVTDNNANVICLGSPVSLPLNCSSPVDFGDLALGSTATVQVDCTALIAITKLDGLQTGGPAFQASNASLPQGPLVAGDKFSFPVTWNLTDENIADAPGVSFGSVAPGVKSSSLTIYTKNGVPKFSTSLPISLRDNTVSNRPFLSVAPAEADFGGLVVGGPGAASGLDSSFIISNVGNSPLNLTGFGYTDDVESDSYVNVTDNKVGEFFTSSDFPKVGTIVAPGESLTVPLNFKTDEVDNYINILQIWSDGGEKNVLMTASATTSPIGELSVETGEGGFTTSDSMDFGDVTAGTTEVRRIRICNKGGSPLTITKSKPPIQPELTATNPLSDLYEGQAIASSECAFGPIDINAAPQPLNVPDHRVSDTWTLNTDDLSFGIHDVQITANIRSRKVGPINPDGERKYQYLGCYLDSAGRQLQKQYNLGILNENGACQTKCLENGYAFAGTEYHVECWCGNKPPSGLKYFPESSKKCTFGCKADSSQACGGDGGHISIYYDTSKYKPTCDVAPCSSSSSSSLVSSTATVSSSVVASSSISTTASGTATSDTTSSSALSSLVTPSSTASSSNTTASGTATSDTTSSSTLNSLVTPSSTASSSTSSSEITSASVSSSSVSSSMVSSTTTASSEATVSSSLLSSTSLSSVTTSTSTGSGSISTSSVSLPKPTGPVTNPGNVNYTHVDCYGNPSGSKSIVPFVKYATDSMTVEICLAYCKSRGSKYAGVEYRRECYCGNILNMNAVKGIAGCTLTCSANTTEYCGGSSKMNLYQAVVLSSSVSSVSTAASSSVSSSAISGFSTAVSTSTTVSSGSSATSTSSEISSVSSSLSSSPSSSSVVSSSSTAAATLSSTSSTSSSSLSISESSSSPSRSESSSLSSSASSSSPSSSPSFSSIVSSSSTAAAISSSTSTSLVSSSGISSTSESLVSSSEISSSAAGSTTTSSSFTSSSTDVTSAISTTLSSSIISSSSASPASSTVKPPRATQGFYYSGCYAEPLSGKAMKQIAVNDSMSIEFCIAEARKRLTAVPATTYRYIGVEYGRECYGATASVTSQTSLVGHKACTIACKGNLTESCGGRAMYNYYLTTAVTTSSTSVPLSTTGTIATTA